MSTETDTFALRIADLERELRQRDERIRALKDEVDSSRDLVRQFEERAKEHDEYLEHFVSVFGMQVNAEGFWQWGELIENYNGLIDRNHELRDKFNRLVTAYNRFAVPPQPIGRPLAASEAQRAQVLRL